MRERYPAMSIPLTAMETVSAAGAIRMAALRLRPALRTAYRVKD
jgi:hypothetical protein